MEQRVRVQKLNEDGTAQVLYVRQSACSGDCHKCSGCGAVEQNVLFTAQNPIGAKPGQVVTVRTESGPVLAAAAVLYILPLVMFFVVYLMFHLALDMGVLGGFLGFALGIAAALVYDRLVVRKKKSVYTITGFVYPQKGDNDLD